MWTVDRLGPNHNVLSLEQQMPQQDTDRSEIIEESEECDDALSELAGVACPAVNVDTWVKAAEFVPGQLWQSMGK